MYLLDSAQLYARSRLLMREINVGWQAELDVKVASNWRFGDLSAKSWIASGPLLVPLARRVVGIVVE
jgi:hypothetical protein